MGLNRRHRFGRAGAAFDPKMHPLRTRQWNAVKNADSTTNLKSVASKHKGGVPDEKDGPPRPKRALLGDITEAMHSTVIDSTKKIASYSQELKAKLVAAPVLEPVPERKVAAVPPPPKPEAVVEFDFDKESKSDPYAVSEFAADIFRYFKSREHKFQVPDYTLTKATITHEIRAKLVSWLVEVQETFELNHETLYLAVKLMDLYFAKALKVDKEKNLLVACAAIFIASKMEERQVPGAEDLVHMTKLEDTSTKYTARQLKALERDFLRTVKYDLGAPLSYSFLRRYGRVISLNMHGLTTARYFLEQSLHFLDFCRVSDSKLAAAALLLALRVTKTGDWSPILEKYTEFKLEQVEPLTVYLNHMSRRFAVTLPKCTTVMDKYSHSVFWEVAKQPLLSDRLRSGKVEVPAQLQFGAFKKR
ncbi:G2/mitotic-specific cyclin-B3 [Aphelenchoides fujianensis]|nr:G2/mitotic-specific cyclin-B3 [Aphelenchoides fujianensis]